MRGLAGVVEGRIAGLSGATIRQAGGGMLRLPGGNETTVVDEEVLRDSAKRVL